MKTFHLLLISLFFGHLSFAQDIKPQEVRNIMKKVADWQMDHINDSYSNKKPHHPLHWTNAALYVGMAKWMIPTLIG